jgi:hypothetical protein
VADVKKQQICIKFRFTLGKMKAKTHKMLIEAFRDNALGQTQTYEWFKSFKKKDGCQSTVTSIPDDLQ